jgi:hypothetical protein
VQGQTSSYVMTSLITAPASIALASLANIKDDLGINPLDTTADNTLTRYISEESAEIARYCNRIFGFSTWQDAFRPQRGVWGEGTRSLNNPLKLTRWPLVVSVVSFTGNTYSNQIIDGIPGSEITQLAVGMLLSGPGITAGTTIASVNLSGSITTSQPTTATASGVSLSTGISITETINLVQVTGLTCGIDFEIEGGSLLPGDEGPSLLYRLNQNGNPRTWTPGLITVVYQAGYALANDTNPNMPGDLAKVTERIVLNRWKSKDRESNLVEQTQPDLGTRRWWVGAQPGQTGPYTNDIMDVLHRYRTPVVA